MQVRLPAYKINIAAPSLPVAEHKRDQKRKRIHGFFGLLFGLVFVGQAGMRIFRYGFDEVEMYTWIALGFGISSFGWLAYKFGSNFWNIFIRN